MSARPPLTDAQRDELNARKDRMKEEAMALGKEGKPLSPEFYPKGKTGFEYILANEAYKAYLKGREEAGLPSGVIAVPLGKGGRKRRTAKGKKRTHKRKTRARK